MAGGSTPAPASIVEAALEGQGYRDRARRLRQRRPAFSRDLVEAFRERSLSTARRDPRAANELARLGLIVANTVRDAAGRRGCLRALAQAHTLAGSYSQALRAIDQALEEPRAADEQRLVAELETVRIPILTHLERYAEARETGRRALVTFEEHGDRGGAFRAHMALAELAFRCDRPREALRHYRQAEARLPDPSAPRLQAVLAVNRGNALEACNRFRAAARQFARAREIFAGEQREHTVAQIDYNAAYAEFLQSRFEEALRRYARVEGTFLQLDDVRHLAHIDLDRAEIHLHLNLPEDALEFAAKAEHRFQKLGLVKEAAQAAQLIGRAAALNGDLEAADEAYHRSQQGFSELGLLEREIGCRVAQAHLAERAGRREEALRRAQTAENALRGAMNPLSAAAVGLLRARLDLTGQRPDEALARTEEVLRTCRRIHAPWAYIEALWLAGRAHADRGELAEAIAAYRQAIDAFEQYRGGVPPDEYMAAFLAGRAALYADIVDLLVRTGDAELAFEFVERAKSRALVDLLAGQAVSEPTSPRRMPTPRRVRYLRERLDAVYRRIFQAAVEPGTPAARNLREAHAEAGEYEQEIARLLRTQRLADPEGASLQTVSAPDLETIRADLEPDTTLLEYYLTDKGVIIFVVDRESTHVVHREVRTADIRRLLERFHFHLSKYQRPKMDAEDLVARATRANLEKLAAIVLGPIADRLEGRRLVIAPHGILHHLPFHALPWDDGWVADRFEVVYVPSAAVYGYCARRGPAAEGPAAVFGLPDERAPQIEDETHRVGELLGSDRVFVGPDATLARLAEESRQARILHIASHGMFRHAEPMLSAIRLADRWVNLYDIYGLECGSELVVLSTCESGVADVTEGDEVLGLTRGFLYAGARALLTSQWRVHDAVTAEFMEAFYANLDRVGDAAVAHQVAMTTIRARHPHPYYWAPFFLTGRPIARGTLSADEPAGSIRETVPLRESNALLHP